MAVVAMTDVWAGALSYNNIPILSFPRRLTLIVSLNCLRLSIICSADCLPLLEIIYHKNTISIPKHRGCNLSSWRNSLCLLWRGWAGVLPLFRLVWMLGWNNGPSFVHSHKPQQKLVRNRLKNVQISTRHILSRVLLISCQKFGYPTGWEFSYIQIFLRNPNNTPLFANSPTIFL